KYQQLAPHIAYAGSLIQQNHGESIDDHGLLIWTLRTHRCRFVPIDNDYIFLDAEIDHGHLINQSHLDQYQHKYLRLRCQNRNTLASEYLRLQDQLKFQYHIHRLKTGHPLTHALTQTPNPTQISQPAPEQKLIQDYTHPDLFDSVIALHAKLKGDIFHPTDDSHAQTHWNLLQ